ncbi:MAG TPA: cytochrome c3 family protein, partial [Chthonomonadaceae bacterium]|nr:cytochrome c3 family protein [Chthonomonadaceae bacterium]
RYCHTTVETSSFAGIPPIHTCMTCHSQVWKDSPMLAPIRDSYTTDVPIQWTRVNFVPDFVYFNHSIHVAKGIGCETCHGRVDEMPLMARGQPLMMAWCLACHRHPERYVRPVEDVFVMDYRPAQSQAVLGPRLVKQYHIRSLQDCYTCHR